MATNRFTISGYGIVEINNCMFQKDGSMPSQLPLDTTDFGTGVYAENGMWLKYDEVAGGVFKPDAVGDEVQLHVSSEKSYGIIGSLGLANFKLAGGAYPRLGRPKVGDTYTTNCFCYETTGDSTFADNAAVIAALGDLASARLYLIPDVTGAPRLTKATDATDIAAAATMAEVVKYTTMPDGTPGIKVRFVKVAG